MGNFSSHDDLNSRSGAAEAAFQPGVFGAMPVVSPRARAPELEPTAVDARLAGYQQEPAALLKEAQRYLSALNRAVVKADRRLTLVDATLAKAYGAIGRLFRKFQLQRTCGTETGEHQVALRQCLEAVDAIAVGYKLVFRDEYQSGDERSKRLDERLSRVGLRLLEVLRLEQRIRALRYQKLPAKAWRDVNQVYFSLALRGLMSTELPMIGMLGIARNADEAAKSTKRKASPFEVFVSIQLFGLLDVMTWPCDLMHAPDTYLDALRSHIHIRPLARGATLAEGCVVIYANGDGPPRFADRVESGAPAVYIDLLPLQVRLTQDRKVIAELKEIAALERTRVPKPLGDVADGDLLPLLDSMKKGFQPRKRRHARRSVYGGEQLRLYIGFHEGYRLLLDLAQGISPEVTQRREFVDALARQSAMLAEDAAAHLSRQWSVMDVSEGGLRVSTEEGDYTQTVKVGDLVVSCPLEGECHPELGYIGRLHRPREGQLDLGIVRLSAYAEAAVIQDNRGREAQTGRPAVLVRGTNDDGWYLVVSSRDAFVCGTPLMLTRPNAQRVPLRLGEAVVLQREFEVFAFRAPGM